jgi:hypothetical protein
MVQTADRMLHTTDKATFVSGGVGQSQARDENKQTGNKTKKGTMHGQDRGIGLGAGIDSVSMDT